ncbi:hypothetical protein [Ideonella paludis]|uniref:hypothetical protein n=1 Tax=Ideonella paludis TaxID=1233411 RepID=UPI00362DB094
MARAIAPVVGVIKLAEDGMAVPEMTVIWSPLFTDREINWLSLLVSSRPSATMLL